MKPIRQMTQLEHFSYIRILFQEGNASVEGLNKVFEELLVYCGKYGSDYHEVVDLL